MRDWFDGLDSREQQFVTIGATVVLVAILYGAVWAPLDQRHDSVRADVGTWQKSLSDLKVLRPHLAAVSTGTTAASTDESPIVVVDTTLQSRGLNPYRTRSQPVSNNGIRVDFENVAFDDLVLWLGDLNVRYGMHVQAGTFSGGNRNGTGRINASITLERAP